MHSAFNRSLPYLFLLLHCLLPNSYTVKESRDFLLYHETPSICSKHVSLVIKLFRSWDCSQCYLFISVTRFFWDLAWWMSVLPFLACWRVFSSHFSQCLMTSSSFLPWPTQGSTCAIFRCTAHDLHRFPGFPTRGQGCVIRVCGQSN